LVLSSLSMLWRAGWLFAIARLSTIAGVTA
jgi:hypothetical protein